MWRVVALQQRKERLFFRLIFEFANKAGADAVSPVSGSITVR